jgi:hypothetical protein
MRRIPGARTVAAVGAVVFASSALSAAGPAKDDRPAVDLKPGQELTFSVVVADGRVTVGPARVSKPGTAEPKQGEITVSLVKHGLSPYADLTAAERTSEPVDFVATGLIGDIKIDEVVLCGQVDAPAKNRISSGSWRVSLNRFSVRQSGQDCR